VGQKYFSAKSKQQKMMFNTGLTATILFWRWLSSMEVV
jgi:hypothetical protein